MTSQSAVDSGGPKLCGNQIQLFNIITFFVKLSKVIGIHRRSRQIMSRVLPRMIVLDMFCNATSFYGSPITRDSGIVHWPNPRPGPWTQHFHGLASRPDHGSRWIDVPDPESSMLDSESWALEQDCGSVDPGLGL
jgi:hypothetical protein